MPMERLVDGLHSYEIVLLVLGVLLFVVLVTVMIYKVKKGESLGGLTALFLVAVAMIGYPSIQKVKISGDSVEIEKLTADLKAAQGARAQAISATLKSKLVTIEQRPVRNANTQLVIAQAQEAVGEREKALRTVEQALAVDPALVKAQALKRRLEQR